MRTEEIELEAKKYVEGVDKEEAARKLYPVIRLIVVDACLDVLKRYDEDIVMDSIEDVFLKLAMWRRESKLSVWIRSIVKNKCLKRMQEEDRFRSFESLHSDEYRKLATKEANEEDIQVRRVVKNLSEEDKKIAEMVMSGMSYKEIGVALGLTKMQWRYKWARLKRQLRGLLG